jgi:hypothetical protein
MSYPGQRVELDAVEPAVTTAPHELPVTWRVGAACTAASRTSTARMLILRTMVFASWRTFRVNTDTSLRSRASMETQNLPPHFSTSATFGARREPVTSGNSSPGPTRSMSRSRYRSLAISSS